MSGKNRLVVGCGYLGLRVARRWLAAGDHVSVVTRSPIRAEEFASQGFHPLIADVTDPSTLSPLSSSVPFHAVLYAVGFDRSAAADMRSVYVDGLSNVLDALPGDASNDPTDGPTRLIYVSSTGVYGDSQGDWVDDSTPCRPLRENGRVCLDAEARLADHPRWGSRSVVLRLAGIYGPHRLPNVAALRSGAPLSVPSDGYLNLIHVDDAASFALAAADHPWPADAPRMFLVSDGQPPLRADYYRELARLVDAPPPQFAPPVPDAPAAQRAAANKRISNALLRKWLPIPFAHPTFRDGLSASLAAQEA